MNRQFFNRLSTSTPLAIAMPVAVSAVSGECPESKLLEHFAPTSAVLTEFKAAGCTIVSCPSAGANRFKLQAYGLADQTAPLNRELMQRCRATLGELPVFGTLGTLGKEIEPFGDLDFDLAAAAFNEQGQALIAGGAEGFIVTGITRIQEARAAIIALRELGNLPVIVELVISDKQPEPGGIDPLSALIILQALGADAIGFTASDVSVTMTRVLSQVKCVAKVPLLTFAEQPLRGSDYLKTCNALIAAGANLIGVHQHIPGDQLSALINAFQAISPPAVTAKTVSTICSWKTTVFLGPDHPFAVVGERINPTGKKALQASLREGDLSLVRQLAREQELRGATILDVNMGLSGVDEKVMMLKTLGVLANLTTLPLCIDTTRPEVMEAALRRYPGRALVNSVSGEQERLDKTLPAAVKYGAMFIVLPLTDAGIPATARERIAVIEAIMETAVGYGCSVADVAVDGLVMTISSNPEAARETLDLIGWCSDTLQVNTIVGLSNVSFGMPERQWINSAFLGMAMGRGLTMAIANPSSAPIMATVQSSNALWGHDATMLLHRGAYSGDSV